MANAATSRRRPWIALALSFLSAGLGHLYCGRIARGLPLYFAWALVPVCITIAALLPPSTTVLVLFVLLPIFVVVAAYLYAAADAFRLAEQIGSDYSLRDYNRGGVYLLLVVGQLVYSVGLIAGLRGLVCEPFAIPVNSMGPTLLSGDRILARKLIARDHRPDPGDVIVYRNPTRNGAQRFVGRVVAVGLDRFEMTGERLVINGREVERERVSGQDLTSSGEQADGRIAVERNGGSRYLVAYRDSTNRARLRDDYDIVVPEHHVFVLGDNRDLSKDSRQLGPIHLADIVGYVDYVYWPTESWSRFGALSDQVR